MSALRLRTGLPPALVGGVSVRKIGPRISLPVIVTVLILSAFCCPAAAKDDWEKYDHDGPVQKEREVHWRELSDKAHAQALERAAALCRGEAMAIEHAAIIHNRFSPRTYDADVRLCLMRRRNEKETKP